MKNCLVTKLNGSVQNNNLPYFGALCISVTAMEVASTKQQIVQIQNNGEPIIIRTEDGSNRIALVDNWTPSTPTLTNSISIETTGTRLLYFDNSASYKVLIDNKYSLKAFNADATVGGTRVFGFDLSELAFNTIMESVYALYCLNVVGDLKDVSNLTTLTRLYLQGTSVTGNLEDIANLTSLTLLSVKQTNINGALDYLVDNIAAAHVAKTLLVIGNGVITLDGATISDASHYIVFDGNGGYVIS